MDSMDQIISIAREMKASDIHISVGMPLLFRVHGSLVPSPVQPGASQTKELIESMLTEAQMREMELGNDLDFAIETSDLQRQRVNVFCQQNQLAATIRLLNNHIPSLQELNLPTKLYDLANEPRGLILVTGPTGSGKSTTLASMIDYINQSKPVHVITIEDPIEYTYESKKALIHQREVGRDVKDFAAALRSSLREDPDIILVGEMRDYETISAALTAAETGHLVLSTLHTTGAAQTIDRIIDACPAGTQNQIRTQLSTVLKAVITQSLMPKKDGSGRVAGTEVLLGTDAVGNLIRENKTYQIASSMQSGASIGMHTLNMDLMRLVNTNQISKQTAMQFTNDKKDLEQYF